MLYEIQAAIKASSGKIKKDKKKGKKGGFDALADADQGQSVSFADGPPPGEGSDTEAAAAKRGQGAAGSSCPRMARTTTTATALWVRASRVARPQASARTGTSAGHLPDVGKTPPRALRRCQTCVNCPIAASLTLRSSGLRVVVASPDNNPTDDLAVA